MKLLWLGYEIYTYFYRIGCDISTRRKGSAATDDTSSSTSLMTPTTLSSPAMTAYPRSRHVPSWFLCNCCEPQIELWKKKEKGNRWCFVFSSSFLDGPWHRVLPVSPLGFRLQFLRESGVALLKLAGVRFWRFRRESYREVHLQTVFILYSFCPLFLEAFLTKRNVYFFTVWYFLW